MRAADADEIGAYAMDFRRALHALRRRAVVLVSGLVVGTLVGLLVAQVQDRIFVARARVLLPPAPGLDVKGRPLRDIETEVHIARSEEILRMAGRRTALKDPTDLRSRIRIRARTADILEVRSEANSPGEAATTANAVADEYVAYANNASSAQVETTVTELQKHAAELEAQIQDLERRVAATNARVSALPPGSPDAISTAGLVAPLLAEQLDAEQRLYTVNTRIGDLRLAAQLSRGGTRVIERALPPDGPARPRPLWNGGVGGLIGLVGGVLLALRREERDRRLRLRSDLADAVRTPVVASLTVPRRATTKAVRLLLEDWRPTAEEELALREALPALGLTHEQLPASINVVTVSGDGAGALAAIKLAAFIAESGIRTGLRVADSSSNSAVRIVGTGTPRVNRVRKNLYFYIESDKAEDVPVLDVIVTLTTAAPAPQPQSMRDRPTFVVLAVSSGIATDDMLARVATASLDFGCRLGGIIVVNPDPDDHTTGHFAVPWPLSSRDASVWIRRAEPTGNNAAGIGTGSRERNDES